MRSRVRSAYLGDMTQWGLDNLFNPGKRHMDDEKRRLQSTREEVGDSSGGRRIDLESGRVAIVVPGAASVETDDNADDEFGPVVEAEDVPAVALANDEAEIEPALLDDEPVEGAAVADDLPIDAPEAEAVSAAPRKKSLSASAWSRRG